MKKIIPLMALMTPLTTMAMYEPEEGVDEAVEIAASMNATEAAPQSEPKEAPENATKVNKPLYNLLHFPKPTPLPKISEEQIWKDRDVRAYGSYSITTFSECIYSHPLLRGFYASYGPRYSSEETPIVASQYMDIGSLSNVQDYNMDEDLLLKEYLSHNEEYKLIARYGYNYVLTEKDKDLMDNEKKTVVLLNVRRHLVEFTIHSGHFDRNDNVSIRAYQTTHDFSTGEDVPGLAIVNQYDFWVNDKAYIKFDTERGGTTLETSFHQMYIRLAYKEKLEFILHKSTAHKAPKRRIINHHRDTGLHLLLRTAAANYPMAFYELRDKYPTYFDYDWSIDTGVGVGVPYGSIATHWEAINEYAPVLRNYEWPQ